MINGVHTEMQTKMMRRYSWTKNIYTSTIARLVDRREEVSLRDRIGCSGYIATAVVQFLSNANGLLSTMMIEISAVQHHANHDNASIDNFLATAAVQLWK